MPALYAGARTAGNAGTGERGNARTTPHERIRSRSRVPPFPRSRLFEAVQAGTSLPRTTGWVAPVADGTLEGLPATVSDLAPPALTTLDLPLEQEVLPGQEPLAEARERGRPLIIVRLG